MPQHMTDRWKNLKTEISDILHCFLPLWCQVSSSSSTLSLLFGKRSFSSGLVISGLSAAEGGNTTDTQSSSSVNIAIGPSHRSSSRATQVGRELQIDCLYTQHCNFTALLGNIAVNGSLFPPLGIFYLFFAIHKLKIWVIISKSLLTNSKV